MAVNHTYIVTNRKRGTLYTGVTSNLSKRIYQHKTKYYKGFSSRYNLNKLVWFEEHARIVDAIAREKQIKGWVRKKKIELIEGFNPEWRDLYEEL